MTAVQTAAAADCRWFRWDGEQWEACQRCQRPWSCHDGVEESGWRFPWDKWRGRHIQQAWERYWGRGQ